MGWFWYLGTLVPVIGLIQVGSQSHADRYTYIPSIGITVAAAWGLAEIARRWPRYRMALAGLAAAACVAAGVVTWRLLPSWRTSDAVFTHAIESTGANYVAEFNLGMVQRSEGRLDAALARYERALAIRPAYAEAQNNIAEILIVRNRVARGDAAPGRSAAAASRPGGRPHQPRRRQRRGGPPRRRRGGVPGRAAARPGKRPGPRGARQGAGAARPIGRGNPAAGRGRAAGPDSPDIHAGLATALALAGRSSEARAEFAAAIRLQPANAQAHFDLGTLLAGTGQWSEAAGEFGEAVRLQPDYVRARVNLGSSLATLGRYDEAIAQFTEALRLQPNLDEARRNLDYARELQARAAKR